MNSQTWTHQPVLLHEALGYWRSKEGGFYVDGTLGLGGHMSALLEGDPASVCLGIDRDPEAASIAGKRMEKFGERAMILCDNYSNLPSILQRMNLPKPDGVLLDLGVSSFQLENPERGFSFRRPGPVDMRMTAGQGSSALDLIHEMSEKDLADIIFKYGEEPKSRKIARALKKAAQEGRLADTASCADVVAKAAGYDRSRQKIHPATRTFQALRIATNDELGHLSRFLGELPGIVAPRGRAVFISFHSLEDRLVKNAFRDLSRGCVCPSDFPQCACGRKPEFKTVGKWIGPSEEEIKLNPRSRSAKMRVLEKI